MSGPARRRTSKAILMVVMGAGLAGLFAGLFGAALNLYAYMVILAAAVFNRLDSRQTSYRASVSTALGRATIEAGRGEAGRGKNHDRPD